MAPVRIDPTMLETGCRALAATDKTLASLVRRNGTPPLWRREPGFPTMVKLILEQQVSLASGAAAYERLAERLGEVTPDRFLTLDDAELKSVGFSRQKTRYVRLLSEDILSGALDLVELGDLPDAEVMHRLQELVGVGPWTAANYLLFALGRPDAWPNGDRALVVSLGRALGRPEPPTYEEAERLAERWRPWRAVAARLLWHDYLGGAAYDPAGF